MRFLSVLALGLCLVGSCLAMPAAQPDPLIIDQIVDVAQVQAIIQELLEHGKQISAQVVQQLIEVAKGAAKEMLLKILEKLLEGGALKSAYVAPRTLPAEIQRILDILKTEGRQAAIVAARRLLATAKGLLKDLIQSLLERLEGSGAPQALIIDRIISIEDINRVLEILKEKGGEAALQLVRELLKTAKGIVRDLLQSLLDRLEGSGPVDPVAPEAFIIDQIVDVAQVQAIIQELLEHGKMISAAVVQQLIDIAKGAAKEMLEKILETLMESGGSAYSSGLPSALIIDQIVDVAQVQAIIQELIEHGKQISAQVVQQLIEVAKGAAKEMLLKILEKLLENGGY